MQNKSKNSYSNIKETQTAQKKTSVSFAKSFWVMILADWQKEER